MVLQYVIDAFVVVVFIGYFLHSERRIERLSRAAERFKEHADMCNERADNLAETLGDVSWLDDHRRRHTN